MRLLLPYYKFSDRGFSGGGKHKTYKFLNLLYVDVCDNANGIPEMCITGTNKDGKLILINTTFNPYRDLSYGGTLIGFRGKNYWISDNTLLGWLIKKL